MIRIRYSLLGEKTRFHSFVLNEDKTFCGMDLTHKGWASYAHEYLPMCAVCAEREQEVRALVALTGEEEVRDPYERLHEALFSHWSDSVDQRSSNPMIEWMRENGKIK